MITKPARDRGLALDTFRGTHQQGDPERVRGDYRLPARHYVDANCSSIEAVARSLIERRFLTYREVRRIVRHRPA
jgi:hypothetical protein